MYYKVKKRCKKCSVLSLLAFRFNGFRWLFESVKKVATSYTTWSPPFLTVILQKKIKNFLKFVDLSKKKCYCMCSCE